jgi:8-oxo-dGTP pyrophosphatase MutT (NUDIX family)
VTASELANGELVARVLESIPRKNESARPLMTIFGDLGTPPEMADALSRSFLALLAPFGVLDVTGTEANSPTVKACSLSAEYFMHSLAAFIRDGRQLLTNWERLGANDGPYDRRSVLAGTQFLYLMEGQRIDGRKDPSALRQAQVAKIVIKARVRSLSAPAYLVQFDDTADQYQLIGGHRRFDDVDLETAGMREAEEELHLAPDNFALRHLGTVRYAQLSKTYGVYTAYEVGFFQLQLKSQSSLALGPGDRWVTANELLLGRTEDGRSINNSGVAQLDADLASGLGGLRLSVEERQSQPIRDLLKRRRWEIIGLCMAIAGIILAIVFYVFRH